MLEAKLLKNTEMPSRNELESVTQADADLLVAVLLVHDVPHLFRNSVSRRVGHAF
jgi:hypothetical protein